MITYLFFKYEAATQNQNEAPAQEKHQAECKWGGQSFSVFKKGAVFSTWFFALRCDGGVRAK